jgi:O-antigen/teichoic acid export membrane protein
VAEGLVSIILLIRFFRQGKIKPRNFSFSLLKESVSYGLPLIGFELSALLLTTGDRFLLQYFLDSEAVGIYSASYNLVKYLVDFFADACRLAAMPLFILIWEKEGKEKTQNFLSSVLRIYFMISIPIIFAVSFIGRDLLILIASKKFEVGYTILPLLIIGYVIHKANFLYAAGLFLLKKTGTLFIIYMSSTIINIVLNILLIPIWGLYGAASATLSAFIFEVILLVSISFRKVSLKLPVYNLIKYAAISIVMIFAMLSINNVGSAQIFLRIGVGILTYFCGILLFETQVRTELGIQMHKIFAK